MANPVTFRTLIDTARSQGRAAHLRPRTMQWTSNQCGICVAQIYNLIDGKQVAPSWTVAKIAKGLGTTAKAVEAALLQSREEAEVTG